MKGRRQLTQNEMLKRKCAKKSPTEDYSKITLQQGNHQGNHLREIIKERGMKVKAPKATTLRREMRRGEEEGRGREEEHKG